MKVEAKLCMATGNGENSYATNSRVQEKAIVETRPVLQKAIEEVYTSLPRRSTMVVADLGCSSGPNTLLVAAEVIGTIRAYNRRSTADGDRDVEVQFFLNDLPGNDFNVVFRSLEQFESLAGKEGGAADAASTPMYYIAGLPGSFYSRLFPCRSVHFFHSSYSLMWRSKVPKEISNGTHVNEGNIYIGKTTPPTVVKLFREQFQRDFRLFLTLRCKELVSDGQMLLTFLGRESQEKMTHGEVGSMWELLAKSLSSLVLKGRLKKEKLDSFNLPFYAPSMEEVKAVIGENKLFDIEHIRLFESCWDPMDDSDADVVSNCTISGANVAMSIRAVLEPLVVDHFGNDIVDELFMVYASMVAKHMSKAKARYPIIAVCLKKAFD